MRRLLLGTGVLLALVWAEDVVRATGPPPAFSVRDYLRDTTVLVVSESYGATHMGSGSVFKRGADSYVLTAAHVVANSKPSLSRNPWLVTVRTPLFERGVRLGQTDYLAEVLEYSNADDGHDLALLKVRKRDYGAASVRFYKDEEVPAVDTPVWHCGNFLGTYYKAVRSGHVEVVGLELDRAYAFDSASFASFQGSSGGPVVLADGRYVGMLTRGPAETLSNYIPVRRIRAWAALVGREDLLFVDATSVKPRHGVAKP